MTLLLIVALVLLVLVLTVAVVGFVAWRRRKPPEVGLYVEREKIGW